MRSLTNQRCVSDEQNLTGHVCWAIFSNQLTHEPVLFRSVLLTVLCCRLQQDYANRENIEQPPRGILNYINHINHNSRSKPAYRTIRGVLWLEGTWQPNDLEPHHCGLVWWVLVF